MPADAKPPCPLCALTAVVHALDDQRNLFVAPTEAYQALITVARRISYELECILPDNAFGSGFTQRYVVHWRHQRSHCYHRAKDVDNPVDDVPPFD